MDMRKLLTIEWPGLSAEGRDGVNQKIIKYQYVITVLN